MAREGHTEHPTPNIEGWLDACGNLAKGNTADVSQASSKVIGRVVSLHMHATESGAPLTGVEEITLVAGKGIQGEPRYFGKISRRTGKPSRRQVSLIEREQIAEHAAALGLQSIPPGRVRSNIETEGIDLVQLIGKQVKIGEAILFFYEGRTPCHQMDAICNGLRALMENNRQGEMAEVVRSGAVRLRDTIFLDHG